MSTGYSCGSMSIRKVFDDRYIVPAYQREYRWKEKQVLELMSDLASFYHRQSGCCDARYWLGDLVVVEKGDDLFEIVEGQQRVISLFILFAVIAKRLREQETPEKNFEDMLFHTERRERTLRLDVHFRGEDARRVLTAIADGLLEDFLCEGKILQGHITPSETVTNMVAAHRVMSDYLDDYPDLDLVDFGNAVRSSVFVARVSTPTGADSLSVYENMNNRGVGLDALDLSKNLIFQHAADSDYSRISDEWNRMREALSEAGEEKPSRFLRYLMLADFFEPMPGSAVTILEKSDRPFEWMSENADRIGISRDPIGFVGLLKSAAKAYQQMLLGNNPGGSPNPYFRNIFTFAPSYRVHLILLLALRGCADEEMLEVGRLLEKMLFVHFGMKREGGVEAVMVAAAAAVRGANGKAAVDQCRLFLSERLAEDIEYFPEYLRSLMIGTGRGHKQTRAKYALAKIAGYVEYLCGQGDPDQYVNRLRQGDYQVEHIASQVARDRGGLDHPAVAMLGNLTILEGPLNASLRNSEIGAKLGHYAQSKVAMTRLLARRVSVGGNTKMERVGRVFADRGLVGCKRWGKAEINTRMRLMEDLAMEVWCGAEPGAVLLFEK